MRRVDVNRETLPTPTTSSTPTVRSWPRGTRDLEPVALTLRDEEVVAIGHDLRGPIAVIGMEVGMLEDKLSVSPSTRASLDRIARNLRYIDDLLQDLLDLSAIDAARFEIARQPVDLCGLVTDTLERMVPLCHRGRVWLSRCGRMTVSADARRIERVVSNLVTNALKYSPPDSPVRVVVDAREEWARVAVIDEGKGLSPHEAELVFDRFHRTSSTKTHEGTGLGLYICRKILDAHHGRIGVHTEPGRGCQFYFELPID